MVPDFVASLSSSIKITGLSFELLVKSGILLINFCTKGFIGCPFILFP